MKHRRPWLSPPPPATRQRSLAPPPPPPPPPAERQNDIASPPHAFRFGNVELVLLLFETPSGFAIFSFCLQIIDRPDAIEDTWTNFAGNWDSCSVVRLNEFRTFEDKSSAINRTTGVSKGLAEMIKKWHCFGQKIAVGKHEYIDIIEGSLDISCLYGPAVMELMWGIQKCMPSSVPGEKSQLTLEDPPPLSKGLQTFLRRLGFDFKPEMVNDEIIAAAGALYKCDSIEKCHSEALRYAGELIKDVSGINSEHWSLLKIATALKAIWWPEEAGNFCQISEHVPKLVNDAHLYEIVLNKESCLGTYGQMVYAFKVKTKKMKQLELLLGKAKEAYEAEQVNLGRNHELTAS